MYKVSIDSTFWVTTTKDLQNNTHVDVFSEDKNKTIEWMFQYFKDILKGEYTQDPVNSSVLQVIENPLRQCIYERFKDEDIGLRISENSSDFTVKIRKILQNTISESMYTQSSVRPICWFELSHPEDISKLTRDIPVTPLYKARIFSTFKVPEFEDKLSDEASITATSENELVDAVFNHIQSMIDQHEIESDFNQVESYMREFLSDIFRTDDIYMILLGNSSRIHIELYNIIPVPTLLSSYGISKPGIYRTRVNLVEDLAALSKRNKGRSMNKLYKLQMNLYVYGVYGYPRTEEIISSSKEECIDSMSETILRVLDIPGLDTEVLRAAHLPMTEYFVANDSARVFIEDNAARYDFTIQEVKHAHITPYTDKLISNEPYASVLIENAEEVAILLRKEKEE